MMLFFAQYSWLEGQSYESKGKGLERFLHQYPVGLLAFMLKGRRRFHQFNSEFPNVYLINALEHEHAHSYWLKRLLLHYISHKEKEDEMIKLRNIINTFTCKAGGGYEEITIRKCLGSLAQANYSNMIYAVRSKSASGDCLQIEDIRLTPRAKHCLSNIFDRFFYLQLIVDDYLLPIPRIINDQFAYQQQLDYGYIVQDCKTYAETAKTMIRLKARQVLLFLEVLDISLHCEREIYPKVFERLYKENVILPNMTKIKDKILSEISKLSSLQGNFINCEELKKHVLSKKDTIKETLNKAYFQ